MSAPNGAAAIWRPDVTVATVVERGGHFLFVEERVRGELVLNQPAGHLDPGETLLDAARRETLEETAWEVRPHALVAIYQWVNPDDGQQFLRFTFAATPLREHPEATLDHGIERALWLTPAELASGDFRPRSPLVQRSLDDYLAGQRVPLTALAAVDWGRSSGH